MQFNLRDNLEKNILRHTSYEEFVKNQLTAKSGVLVLIKDRIYFSDDGVTTFLDAKEAEESIKTTSWWKTIIEYAEFSSKFFLDRVDEQWKDGFLQRVWAGMITDGFIKFIDLGDEQ